MSHLLTAPATHQLCLLKYKASISLRRLFCLLAILFTVTSPTFAQQQQTTAVLLVHGTWSDAQTWNHGMSQGISQAGFTVEAVDFPTEPETLSNETYIELQAKALARRITELMTRSGKPSVDLVCHSMGGLAARYYLEHSRLWPIVWGVPLQSHVSKLIMLGTPNWGTDGAMLDPVATVALAHLTSEPRPGINSFSSAVDTYDNWSPAVKEMFAEWEPAPFSSGQYSYPVGFGTNLGKWYQNQNANYEGSIQYPASYDVADAGLLIFYGTDLTAVQDVLNIFPDVSIPALAPKEITYYRITAQQLGAAYPSNTGVRDVNYRFVSPFLVELNSLPDNSGAQVFMIGGTRSVPQNFGTASHRITVRGPWTYPDGNDAIPNDGVVPTDSALGREPISGILMYPNATRLVVGLGHTDLPKDGGVISQVIQWLEETPSTSGGGSGGSGSGGTGGGGGTSNGTDSDTYNNSTVDVTYPDGTAVPAGQAFTKTWHIINNGTTTWGSGYQWVFEPGYENSEQMSGPNAIAVPTVPPGGSWNPSVNLVSPASPGVHVSHWRMQGPHGAFGPHFYVSIVTTVGVGELSDYSFDQRFIDCYNSVGGSVLGQPFDSGGGLFVHDYAGSFGNGLIQNFNGGTGGQGAILAKPGYVASSVHGSIYAKYIALGGGGCFLGFPVTDEGAATASPQGTSGRFNNFEGGAIYSSTKGIYEVHGAIFTKYARLGGSGSVLGFPTSDEMAAAASPQGSLGQVSRFEGGSIYNSNNYGSYAVYGTIDTRYEASGGSGGPYGFPTSDPTQGPLGMQQSFEGGTIYQNLTVASISITPNPYTSGGISPTGTITLAQPAPSGGVTVVIGTSNIKLAEAPPVTIPAGATSATFTVYIDQIVTGSPQMVTLSVLGGSASPQTTFTINPQSLAVTSFTINPTSVSLGTEATGTVTFNGPAPDGAYLFVKSTNSYVASVNGYTAIPTGVTSFSVPIFSQSASTTPVTFTSQVIGTQIKFSATLMVTPAPPTPISIPTSVVLTPSTVYGGNVTSGTVTLNSPAPTGGTTVTISSSETNVATVQGSNQITIPAGATSASFNLFINNAYSTTSRTATIAATTDGGSTNAILTVNPQTNSLASMTVSPTTVVGGAQATLTLILQQPAAPGGVRMLVGNSQGAWFGTPLFFTYVTVPAGATSGTVQIFTPNVAANEQAKFSSGFGGVSQSATLTVLPMPITTLTASVGSVSRHGPQIVVPVTIINSSSSAAMNVQITSAILGTSATPMTSMPQAMGTIPAGTSQTVTLRFTPPRGGSPLYSRMQVSGTFTGGTFSTSMRVTLP